MRQKLCAICLPALLILTLSGCMQTVRLKERAIVQAVGVDYRNEQFALSIRYFTPQESGGNQAFDASQNNGNIIRSQGETMTQAVEEAARLYGRQVFFGSNRVIVLGEGLARHGIRGAVDYFNANHQLDPSVYIFLARGSAEDIVGGGMDADRIEQMAVTATKHSHINGGTMLDLVTRLEEGRGAVDIPRLIQENGEIRIEGAGLMKDQKLEDDLMETEVRGILWLNGKASKNVMVVDLEDGRKASLEIISSKAHKRPRVNESGELTFTYTIEADSTLREILPGGSGGMDAIPEAARAQEAKIRQLARLALQKTVEKNQTDILGLASSLRKYEPRFYAGNAGRLDELLAGAQFEIDVRCRISRIGLEANEKKM